MSDAGERKADHREVGDDDRADEDLENQQELALLHQIGLAGLVDQLGDLGHRAVHRQALDAGIRPGAEEQAQHADDQPRQQDLMAGHAEEIALIEIGQVDVHLAAGHVLRRRLGLGRRLAAQSAAPRSEQGDSRQRRGAQRHIVSSGCVVIDLLSQVSDAQPVRQRHAAGQEDPDAFLDGQVGKTRLLARIDEHVAEIQVIGRHIHRHDRLRRRGRDPA